MQTKCCCYDPASESADWKTDGFSGFRFENAAITCKSFSGDTARHSAMWIKDGALRASEESYYEFTVSELQGKLSIGTVAERDFTTSKQFVYFGYNGDLEDGLTTIKKGFGLNIAKGDTIGMHVALQQDGSVVSLRHNDRMLGIAFTLPRSTAAHSYPVVRFVGSGTVKCKKTSPPENAMLSRVDEAIYGNWTLTSCLSKGQKLPFESEVSLEVVRPDSADGTIIAVIDVVNDVDVSFKRTSFGTWIAKLGSSTKMGGTPEEMLLKDTLSSAFANLSELRVTSDGQLVVNSTSLGITATFAPALVTGP